MNTLYFVIGASGSGKTTAVQALNQAEITVAYFDSIGVPTVEAMIKDFGSPEGWQRDKTLEWVKTIKERYLAQSSVVLDGQTRPQYIHEACQQQGIKNYEIILFDCLDSVRKTRLEKRGQPELFNEQMSQWAAYLRKVCQGYTILDNTDMSPEETALALRRSIK